MRRISLRRDRSIRRFSPSVLWPLRSSPSSEMIGGPSLRDLNELPRACTTPFLPLASSYRHARSRSISSDRAERLNRPPPELGGRAVQFRLTLSSPLTPPPPPCLLSDTVGAFLVRVTLLRLTPEPEPEPGSCEPRPLL